MEKQWKEEHLLQLVDAVTKVEEKQKWILFGNPKAKVISGEEKWDQVAAKIPFSLFVELNRHGPTPIEKLPGICRAKFLEICEYFNRVFMKSDRNYCLSRALMTKLAEFSNGFPDQPFFSKTGPQAKLIKIDPETEAPADSASAVVADCFRIRDLVPHLSTLDQHPSPNYRSWDLDQHPSSKYRSWNRQKANAQVDAPLDQISLEVSDFCTSPNDRRDSGLHRGSGRQISNAEVDTRLKERQQYRLNNKNVKFREVEFVKKMVHSHVVKTFFPRIPKDFCTANLAHYDLEKSVLFELVDKDRNRCKVNYLPKKNCLSAGWGIFAKKRGLQLDDIVRFRLVNLKTFQVTINEDVGEYETYRGTHTED